MTTETSPVRSLIKNWQKTYGYLSGQFVRISSLRPENRVEIAKHLQALPEQDRYFRFGFHASDQHIHKYVDGLNFVHDHVYGIYNHQAVLVAVAHVAHMSEHYQPALSFGLGFSQRAEFGVSVLPAYRGKGYGGRLFNRAVIYARNHGISELYIHALTENSQMLHIAKKGGATLVNFGSETEAHLLLPKADLDSRMSELLAEHFGNVDYNIAHGKNWMHRLAQLPQAMAGNTKITS
ncbi:MAG: GNAT family N-acetyltransferase [Cytophagales bacterium]|nr:GNAT family N-acetyltransferase [Cytophagales bacterium]